MEVYVSCSKYFGRPHPKNLLPPCSQVQLNPLPWLRMPFMDSLDLIYLLFSPNILFIALTFKNVSSLYDYQLVSAVNPMTSLPTLLLPF